MAAVDSPSAWRYSALRWFTTRWIRATARGRCTQLPACLIATTSDFLVAALVVSRVSMADACRDAGADADDDGPEDEVCGSGVPGAECLDRTNATTTAITTIAVPTAPSMSLVRLGVGRDGRGRCCPRPGPAGEPPPAHSGRPAGPAHSGRPAGPANPGLPAEPANSSPPDEPAPAQSGRPAPAQSGPPAGPAPAHSGPPAGPAPAHSGPS